ncbi:hypothetical protein [uncultured Erythrobacter sp.]|uniref:hypothetical protein n=1 Tax=uncultured Erythrobacter sp. TaxID=263913 RepID=UPI00261A357C|nr:hypothetical protein [uncultured Erythrobacter sp.]
MTNGTEATIQAKAPKGLSTRLQSAALLAEIIGALAIVISLIFVGMQVQQNTQATRAASAFEVNRMWARNSFGLAEDPSTALLTRKLLDPSNMVDDFDEEERARAELVIQGTVQGHLAAFRLFQEGSLLRRDWEVHGKWAARFRRLPLVKLYYDSTIAAGLYDAEYIAEIERLDALIGEDTPRLSDYAPAAIAEEAETGSEQ